MKIIISQIRTKDGARQKAIDWQNWQSKKALSYSQMADWTEYFRSLAKKFHLIREFKREGII